MECPVCKSHEMGRISKNRYFCRNCCREMKFSDKKIQLAIIAENGRLLSYKSLKTS